MKYVYASVEDGCIEIPLGEVGRIDCYYNTTNEVDVVLHNIKEGEELLIAMPLRTFNEISEMYIIQEA